MKTSSRHSLNANVADDASIDRVCVHISALIRRPTDVNNLRFPRSHRHIKKKYFPYVLLLLAEPEKLVRQPSSPHRRAFTARRRSQFSRYRWIPSVWFIRELPRTRGQTFKGSNDGALNWQLIGPGSQGEAPRTRLKSKAEKAPSVDSSSVEHTRNRR